MPTEHDIQLCVTGHLPFAVKLDVVGPTLSSYNLMMSLPAVKLEGGCDTNGPCMSASCSALASLLLKSSSAQSQVADLD